MNLPRHSSRIFVVDAQDRIDRRAGAVHGKPAFSADPPDFAPRDRRDS
ncbi:MAG: hypothetical protein HY017_14740 [Betaproteobacteria bacterium]|nr:hypothetical protein [Betaproteobacteria bacterium]